MDDEVLDVVNDLDRVIGRDTRARIHKLRLKHRATHILVFNSRGQLFLQKRARSKHCSPGLWDTSAAGHVDGGEDYDHCAVRELREELGIELNGAPERLLKLDACEATGQEFVWVYRLVHDGPIELSDDEIEQGRWFAPDAIDAWIEESPNDLSTTLRLIWRQRDYLLP